MTTQHERYLKHNQYASRQKAYVNVMHHKTEHM